MRGSVVTSLVLHALLLGWMMIVITPKPLDMTITEAMPVELVPVDDAPQLMQGDKDAPKTDKPSKDITKKQDDVKDAMNAGENNFDMKSVPTPTEKPSNLSKAGAPKKVEEVNPQQDNTVQEADPKTVEDTEVDPSLDEMAAAEVPTPDLKPEPTPEPAKETPVEETAKEDPLPTDVPIPSLRPQEEPKKVETKEDTKPEKKVEEKPKEEKKETKVDDSKKDKAKNAKKSDKSQKTKKSTTTKDSDFNADEIATLLNKTDDTPGGAKRSNTKKSFGAEKATGSAKMSQSELDALRGMIEKNWSILPGQVNSGDIIITVTFQLDQNGELVGRPEVKASGGDGSSLVALESGAVRAVMKSAPFDQLPKDKYDTWSEVTINFQPSDIM